jgi:epoxyqueuosine reductase QueG
MDKITIINFAKELTQNFPVNHVASEVAISPDYAGMKIFEPPIFAFGCPKDELFTKFKSPGIIGEHFLSPCEWMPGAKTVISFFLPYTERIRSANSQNSHWPADEWLHGRIEGQLFVKELSRQIQKILLEAGHESLVPSFDARSQTWNEKDKYTSNWSERHVAFACGLGTFGLSKGLITEKGTCGRLGSVLTSLDLPKDIRRYTDTYEYCIKCGECVKQCPVGSISLTSDKNQLLCSSFLDKTMAKHSPRYGCGKCQVNVPCENGIPDRNFK